MPSNPRGQITPEVVGDLRKLHGQPLFARLLEHPGEIEILHVAQRTVQLEATFLLLHLDTLGLGNAGLAGEMDMNDDDLLRQNRHVAIELHE